MVNEVINGVMAPITNIVLQLYRFIIELFSPYLGDGVKVFLLAILIAAIAIFIWNFYKSISQKDLITLNLSRYNTAQHPSLYKLLAIVFFFLEYLILMPVLILLWFFALSIIILVIAEEREINQILLISAAMVTSVRILAYHKNEIAKDLAKLFPLITLSVFLLSPRAFDLEIVLGKISAIPSLLGSVFYFLLIIIIVEVFLRALYTIMEFWQSEEEAEKLKKS